MNTFKKTPINALLAILLAHSLPAHAVDKPKTMDEMWQIIKAQQQQIDSLKAAVAAKTEPATTANTSTATAAPAPASNEVKNLERKTNVLSQEVEKLRTNLAIPEEPKYKSAYGLGPAASKVYSVGRGLSLGGYGEAMYSNIVGDKGSNKDTADMERMVIYAGYKFNDHILFNSELEFEHATTGEGSELKGEVS